ncbi:hybrid sensor histidine kinase/response regulator [Chitinophaga pollutisoli]|uniref:histidine kinase n=1 Tax=Chitinophaga pollutisoli TaxID=3133966 RepID=A0ABZ2YQF5_9BACT
MSQKNPQHNRFSLREQFTKIRNAGVLPFDTAPRTSGLRFMNLSSLVAASFVLFFGVPLAIISGQYSILILAIPVSFLFFSVIIYNFLNKFIVAVWIWQFTFCISTFVFGLLEREVIDATHMIPFLVAAPAFVLWKADYRSHTLPACILMAVITYVGMEISAMLNLLPALPLKEYYWYFRPATLATIYSLNVMVFWKLLKEMDVVFAKLAKAIQDEKRAKGQVERYAEQMQLYATLITHEIKTPLSALKSIAVAFQSTVNSEEKSNYMTRADACVNHLQAVVDNAQLLAKLNSGESPLLANDAFSIRALISELVSFYSYEAQKHRVTMVYNCDEGTPPYIEGDPQSIKQVVTNLISNAIKFSRKDTTIVVRVSSTIENCSITVEDQGKGIAPSALNRIFDRFYTTPDGNNRGVGIGLYVSSMLANLMKGSLNVESIVGSGSKFTLSIPLLGKKSTSTENRNWQGYRILIVEDAVFLAEITAELLEKYGFTTRLALSGEDAIKQAIQFEPHLILLDFSLPDMDGIGVINKLQHHPLLESIPVFILTGQRMDNLDWLYVRSCGKVVGYIHKPFGRSGIDQVLNYLESTM